MKRANHRAPLFGVAVIALGLVIGVVPGRAESRGPVVGFYRVELPAGVTLLEPALGPLWVEGGCLSAVAADRVWDGSALWATNEWAGHTLVVADQPFSIASNTGQELIAAVDPATPVGTGYGIIANLEEYLGAAGRLATPEVPDLSTAPAVARQPYRIESPDAGMTVITGIAEWPAADAATTAPALTAGLLPSTNAVLTRLRHQTNGTVAVEFKGIPGQSYRIEVADELAASAAEMPWRLAAAGVTAGTNTWTVWVDAGADDRVPPDQAAQRYYQVIEEVETQPPPPAVGGNDQAAPQTGWGIRSLDLATAMGRDPRLIELKEAYDAGRMMGALAVGNHSAALAILREYGVSEATLAAMAARLGTTPARVPLKEAFLKGMLRWGQASVAELSTEQAVAAKYGCERVFTIENSPAQGLPFTAGAIGALWGSPYEPNAIRLFKWYDAHVEQMHSVAVNLGYLHNEFPEVPAEDARLVIHGLYQLIKARNPDAFVWTTVWWWVDRGDTKFLKALPFRPDGLLVVNLHSFRSRFEDARQRYPAIVGADVPMVLLDFQGCWPDVEGRPPDPVLGRALAAQMPAFEQRLEGLGYRGVIFNLATLQHMEAARP